MGFSHKTRDWRRIDKGRMFPNTYSSITATTIEWNLSNTAWYMMKHWLWPDLCLLTGQFRDHLTETYNEPRDKEGCHGRSMIKTSWCWLSGLLLIPPPPPSPLSLSLSLFSPFISFSIFRKAVCLVCLNGNYGYGSAAEFNTRLPI